MDWRKCNCLAGAYPHEGVCSSTAGGMQHSFHTGKALQSEGSFLTAGEGAPLDQTHAGDGAFPLDLNFGSSDRETAAVQNDPGTAHS